jgi:hypothetical protein
MALPRGGRKGGQTFPRVALREAVSYAHRLVSEVGAGAQPRQSLLAKVLGTTSARGAVKLSAMKQFGLLEGDLRSLFRPTLLARALACDHGGPGLALMRQAALKPKVFRELFSTFQGRTINRVDVRHRAQALGVHSDSALICVSLYVRSLETAQLAFVAGDAVAHAQADDGLLGVMSTGAESVGRDGELSGTDGHAAAGEAEPRDRNVFGRALFGQHRDGGATETPYPPQLAS